MKKDILIYLKKFFVPVLAISIIVSCSVTVVFPRINLILSIRKKTKTQENDIKKLTEKINQLKTLSEAELISDSQMLMEYFPEENDIFKSILVIRQLTNENNVIINEFAVSPGLISSNSASTKESGPKNSSSIEMEISGSLDDQKAFLKKMENTFPLMGIEGVEISSSFIGTESSRLNSTGSMTVLVFFGPVDKKKLGYFNALPEISASSEKIINEIKNFEKIIPPEFSGPPVLVGRDSLF